MAFEVNSKGLVRIWVGIYWTHAILVTILETSTVPGTYGMKTGVYEDFSGSSMQNRLEESVQIESGRLF